jgi:small subunit ribosomal protein S19
MRSSWKLPYISTDISKIVKSKDEDANLNFLVTKSRSSTITPKMVNTLVKIYNGIKFVVFKIKEEHVGYKLGNFTITKKRCIFRNKSKKKNKSKK